MKMYLPMMSLDGSAFNLRKGGVIQTVNRGDQDPYSVNLTFSPGIRIREEVSRVIIPLLSRRLQWSRLVLRQTRAKCIVMQYFIVRAIHVYLIFFDTHIHTHTDTYIHGLLQFKYFTN